MDILIKTHQEISEKDFTQLWEKGLFVFDANVLLDLYRLPEDARKDLFKILSDKNFNKQIWLPFQVLLEFLNNKLEAINEQKKKFGEVKKILKDAIEKINNSFGEMTKQLNSLQLEKRHSIIKPDSYTDNELIKEPIEKINKFITELDELEKKQPEINHKDDLYKKILKIFTDKIGIAFSKEELEKIFKDGEIRYKENIPPGFKDKDKEGFYLFEDKKIIKKYGDLVVWKEIINKAKSETLEYVVLITGDVKEDWWQIKSGKKLRPRPELLNEIYFEANSVKVFHIYDTSSFMKYAKQYLKIDVKEESIKETKDLIEQNAESFASRRERESSFFPINSEINDDYHITRVKQISDALSRRNDDALTKRLKEIFEIINPLTFNERKVLSVFNLGQQLSFEEIYEKCSGTISESELSEVIKMLVSKEYLKETFSSGVVSIKAGSLSKWNPSRNPFTVYMRTIKPLS